MPTTADLDVQTRFMSLMYTISLDLQANRITFPYRGRG